MVKNWLKPLVVGLLLSISVVSTNATAPAGMWKQKPTYQQFITAANPKISDSLAKEISTAAQRWAMEFDLDSGLLIAIAKVESNFYHHAISSSGAYGLMQIIPLWHKDKIIKARKELGNPEIFNINTNMYLGAMILKDCIKRTNNKLAKALLCYSGQTPGYDAKVLKQYAEVKTALKIRT